MHALLVGAGWTVGITGAIYVALVVFCIVVDAD